MDSLLLCDWGEVGVRSEMIFPKRDPLWSIGLLICGWGLGLASLNLGYECWGRIVTGSDWRISHLQNNLLELIMKCFYRAKNREPCGVFTG